MDKLQCLYRPKESTGHNTTYKKLAAQWLNENCNSKSFITKKIHTFLLSIKLEPNQPQ
jgi:hypothetical protein